MAKNCCLDQKIKQNEGCFSFASVKTSESVTLVRKRLQTIGNRTFRRTIALNRKFGGLNRCLSLFSGAVILIFFPRCRSRPGSTTNAAPRRKRASTPRQCLTRTSSVSSRGCRPSGWTSSESICPTTSRTTPRPRTRSPPVASPARTSRGRCVGKNKVEGSKRGGDGGVAWCGWEDRYEG